MATISIIDAEKELAALIERVRQDGEIVITDDIILKKWKRT